MKCGQVRTFMSQVAGKSVSTPVQVDVSYLSANGYVLVMPKDEYDRAAADVARMVRMNEDLYQERLQAMNAQEALRNDEQKTHSIMFHFEGKEKQEADTARVESERSALAREWADITDKDSQIAQIIQKKSMVDRMTLYNG